jgi:DNA-binding protein
VALRKSLEALETVCGRGDRRTVEVAKLLSAALENRLRVQQIRVASEDLGQQQQQQQVVVEGDRAGVDSM